MKVGRAEGDFNERYQNGEALMLVLHGVDEEGEEQSVELPCGKGWDKKDRKGRKCDYPGKSKKRFNNSSFVGKLIEMIIAKKGVGVPVVDTRDKEKTLPGFGMLQTIMAKPGNKKLSPFDAAIYEGLVFEFKQTDFSYGTRTVTNDEGEDVKEKMTSSRVFPVACFGYELDSDEDEEEADDEQDEEEAEEEEDEDEDKRENDEGPDDDEPEDEDEDDGWHDEEEEEDNYDFA